MSRISPFARPTTMRLCAVSCAPFSGLPWFLVLQRGRLPLSFGGLGLRVPVCCQEQFTGQVGLIVCRRGFVHRFGKIWPQGCARQQTCGRFQVNPAMALFRSQGGPLSQAFHSPVSPRPQGRFDSTVFRVLLLRRLWQPLLPSSRFCRCGLILDPFGHHRAACGGAGVLGRRAFALESVAARLP